MRTFLIPPVCGDDFDLSALRDRLSSCVHLELVELPDIGAPGAILSSMKATGASVVSEIVRRRPANEVGLVGFSFGASTALEVAAQLTTAGYSISYLAILDGPFATSEMQGWFELFRRAKSAKGSARTLAEMTAESDFTRRAAWAAFSPERVGQHRSDPIRRAMLAHLRGKALKGWVPQACYARGILIRTQTFGALNHQRWGELCPNLQIADVPGDHENMIRGSSLDLVVGILEQSFRRMLIRVFDPQASISSGPSSHPAQRLETGVRIDFNAEDSSL